MKNTDVDSHWCLAPKRLLSYQSVVHLPRETESWWHPATKSPTPLQAGIRKGCCKFWATSAIQWEVDKAHLWSGHSGFKGKMSMTYSWGLLVNFALGAQSNVLHKSSQIQISQSDDEELDHELWFLSCPPCCTALRRNHAALLPASSSPLTFPQHILYTKSWQQTHFLLREHSPRVAIALLSCKHLWKKLWCKDGLKASRLSSDINKYLFLRITPLQGVEEAALQHYLNTTVILHFYWELFISNKSCCYVWEIFVFNTCAVF